MGLDCGSTIESYQHAEVTSSGQAKKKLFTDVTDSRTITDIFNAVEPASNGHYHYKYQPNHPCNG